MLEFGVVVFHLGFVLEFVLFVVLMLLSVQFSSVAQSCLTLCDPVDCSMPGFPVHHQLPLMLPSSGKKKIPPFVRQQFILYTQYCWSFSWPFSALLQPDLCVLLWCPTWQLGCFRGGVGRVLRVTHLMHLESVPPENEGRIMAWFHLCSPDTQYTLGVW